MEGAKSSINNITDWLTGKAKGNFHSLNNYGKWKCMDGSSAKVLFRLLWIRNTQTCKKHIEFNWIKNSLCACRSLQFLSTWNWSTQAQWSTASASQQKPSLGIDYWEFHLNQFIQSIHYSFSSHQTIQCFVLSLFEQCVFEQLKIAKISWQ